MDWETCHAVIAALLPSLRDTGPHAGAPVVLDLERTPQAGGAEHGAVEFKRPVGRSGPELLERGQQEGRAVSS